MGIRRPSEHDEAVILRKWMDLRGIVYFHVPNEGKRRPPLAARLKAEGLKAGVPDYVILSRQKVTPKDKCALFSVAPVFIELKKTGGRTTPEQRRWHLWLVQQGYTAAICYGANAAIAFLETLGY